MNTPDESLYNPVLEGLGAQIWECLRRNARFKASFVALKSITSAARASANSELRDNVFSRVLSDAFRQGSIELDAITLAWPTLPANIRAKFNSLVDALRETPAPIHPPSILHVNGPFSPEDQRTLINYLRHLEKYEALGLPRIILDEQHRRECKKMASSSVPRVKKSPLGAERQWATYLLMEKHQQSPLRDHAKAFAAWEHLEAASYQRFRGSRYAEKGIAEARRALSRQGAEFEKRIKTVEAAIESVYPVFAVFDSLTEASGEPLR